MELFGKQVLMVAVTCLSLAGCSGEPSKSDMQKAVQKAVATQTAAMGLGDIAGFSFSSFEKQACVAAQNAPGYVCDFSFTVKGGPSQSAKGRFVNGKEGWIFQEG